MFPAKNFRIEKYPRFLYLILPISIETFCSKKVSRAMLVSLLLKDFIYLIIISSTHRKQFCQQSPLKHVSDPK